MGIMAIVLTKQKTEQTAETTSCEQKAMTWWETSKTTPRHRQTTETTQTNTLMSLQLRQHRTTQTTDTTQRPLKANTLVSTDTTQTLERTQTLDISLTTARVIATAPTSDG